MEIWCYPEIYIANKFLTIHESQDNKQEIFHNTKILHIYFCKYISKIKYFTKHNAYLESLTANNISPFATRSQEKDEPGETGET